MCAMVIWKSFYTGRWFMSEHVSRRSMLKGSAVAIAAAVAGGALVARGAFGEETTSASSIGRRVLRFAHPTDIHVQPELGGDKGMALAFQHMMGLKDPPAMILCGGDLPMDTA